MKAYFNWSNSPLTWYLLAAFLLLLGGFSLHAAVLDNFDDNNKTGWTDTLNAGSVTEGPADQRFHITPVASAGALTYSRKTATNYTIVAGGTLEFAVDVVTVAPASPDTNALAILAFVPTAVLGDGYSLTVGANDVKIRKGATVLYSTNLALQNTDITMVLRMTPSGGGVSVNARVYKKIVAGTSFNQRTVLFEYTYQDASASLVGVNGNAALGVVDQNGVGTSVAFDTLQVFVYFNTLLDDFNSGGLTGWAPFVKHPSGPDVVTNIGNAVELIAGPDPTAGFAGIYYAAKTFKIIDGGRVEFSIDCVANALGLHAYTVLGFVPASGASAIINDIFQLIEYHIAEDPGDVYNGKAYNNWWSVAGTPFPNFYPGPFPDHNFRLTITMTGEGSGAATTCRIESRAEDLSLDVNDPNRVFYQAMRIDTLNADANEVAALKTPFVTVDGTFAVDTFADSTGTADITVDNAIVNQTLPPNAAPNVIAASPNVGTSFLSATNCVTFTITDEQNVVSNSIVLTLNGVRYTNGSPGVTVSGGATAATRTVTVCGILTANVFYSGTIVSADPQGLSSTNAINFDTFVAANAYVVESEEYNFGNNGGVNGGLYIDNPVLVAEGFTDPNAYNGQLGVPEIDFHDNRTAVDGGADAHTFRTDDNLRTTRSSDTRRKKYSDAGAASDGWLEEEVIDIDDGDWMNYTHHYPSGAYNVFLRQAQLGGFVSLVTLDLVTSDATTNGQTTTTLGSFFGSVSGTGQFRDVPLTDGVGNLVVLRFDGSEKTLRISERVTGNSSANTGILEQNYFILVPVANPGTLRPILSSASPLPGSTIAPNGGNSSSSPATTASIANRDTSVSNGTVVLTINGNPIAATVNYTATGADISWCLTNLPVSRTYTNTVTFKDTQGTNLTYSWTYSYLFLSASNSLPFNALSDRGWSVHMVQADNGGATLGNSLARAEQQLAYPPQSVPADREATNTVQELYWSNDSGSPANVPGLTELALDNIATECLGYMQLKAGAHRFRVNSDDGYQLRSGATLRDPAGVVVGYRDGGTISATFDFVVEADGLYPARCVWYENGGGANFQLNSVAPCGGPDQVINDPGNPVDVVKVFYPFYPVSLYSSATANAGYAIEPTAVVNLDARTVTIGQSGARRFYKLNAPTSAKIDNVAISGTNVVMHYTFQ